MTTLRYIERVTKYETAEVYRVQTPVIGYTVDIPQIKLYPAGMLEIGPGFGFDPSGPTIDTDAGIFASCAHDAFYRLMRLGLIPMSERGTVDDFFGDQCERAGMSDFRATIWERGVELFADGSANPNNAEEVKEITVND